MDWYLVSVIVFIAVLAVLVYRDRRKYKRESILLLRRTQRGKATLVWLGTRFPRFWKYVGFVSVVTGFIVSVYGLKMLADNFTRSLVVKASTPGLALLLPSPTSQPIFGYGFLAVPFWYWIICIALLSLVHEGFHGIFTAREGVRIKSWGMGILAVIPLAFVEPDEKKLEKKGTWPMLRVYSAGSFANFLAAGASLLIVIALVMSIYTASGVDFGLQTGIPYPAAMIPVSSIISVGGEAVSSPGDIVPILGRFGENDTVGISAANGTFYIRKSLLLAQLNGSPAGIVAYEDYPAAKAGLEGTIIRAGGREVRDPLDLSLALEDAGPGANITMVTRVGGAERAYVVETVPRPEAPAYVPDSGIYYLAGLEHVFPGSVDFFQSAGDGWAGLLGQRTGETWVYASQKVAMWGWIRSNYPLIAQRAGERLSYWEGRLAAHREPGFIGIIGITPDITLKAGLEPFREAMDFVQGLLFFLVVINLGVAIVNLLPLKPLDGGRMWDVVLKRYLPKRRAEIVMKALTYFTLLLLVINFIPVGLLL